MTVLTENSRPTAPIWSRCILWTVLGLLYLPLLVMVVGAWIRRDVDGFKITTEWFEQVFRDPELGIALARSVGVAVAASALATAIGTLTAIALERTNFSGKNFVRSLSMISLVMPELVFALSLLSWFVVLRVELSLVTVVFAHVTLCLAFVILTVTARLDSIDPNLADAARDLGASEMHILTRVILPLLGPGIVSAFLLSFMLSFDDFLITFYTTGAGQDTLPIKLYTAMRVGITPKLDALASLMLFASLALTYVFMRIGGLRSLVSKR